MRTALVAAFHDGKIPTRGRCRSWFGHDRLTDLRKSIWDRANVGWEVNKFAVPASDQSYHRVHTFSDVVVHRKDLEKWINGAIPDSQGEPQEDAENLPPKPRARARRERPAEQMHERWITKAKELRGADRNMGVSEIARKIRREDAKSKDPSTKGETREIGTIRRVLTDRRNEWDSPPES